MNKDKKYDKFVEHKHEKLEEFEVGVVSISLSYEIIVFNKNDRFKGMFDPYYDEDEAKAKYNEIIEEGQYDYVVFSEVQTHSIVKEMYEKGRIK